MGEFHYHNSPSQEPSTNPVLIRDGSNYYNHENIFPNSFYQVRNKRGKRENERRYTPVTLIYGNPTLSESSL